MNIHFNSKKPLILDGGMGQFLIQKGMKLNGTLWSGSALIDSTQHNLVIEAHKEFLEAGAKVIVTSNFTIRKLRLSENDATEYFEKALRCSGELAIKAKSFFQNKDIFIAGSIPTRNDTYSAEFKLNRLDVYDEIYDTANILNEFVDFYYLDTLTSIEEIELALRATANFKKKILIGAHVLEKGIMPDGNTILQLENITSRYNILGIIVSCVSRKNALEALRLLKDTSVPFGFKVNAFDEIPKNWKLKSGDNPTISLGKDKDFNDQTFIKFSEECTKLGASIIGGCCEVMPSHIRALSKHFYN